MKNIKHIQIKMFQVINLFGSYFINLINGYGNIELNGINYYNTIKSDLILLGIRLPKTEVTLSHSKNLKD